MAEHGNTLVTHHNDHVSVRRLHLGGGRSILIASKIFSINHRYDGVQLEVIVCFTLELSNLKCEGCWECGAAETV